MHRPTSYLLPVAALLAAATATLRETSATPRLDAELLLAHVLGWPRARVIAERDQAVADAQAAAFRALVDQRAAGAPVAYLVGHREFYGLDLLVDPRVLIPRPETELLVDLALMAAYAWVQKSRELTIVDIGTGSGAIAIALARHLPEARIYAIDISAEALEVAAANVARHGVGAQVLLLHGDMLAPLPEPAGIIVSNPPYTLLDAIDPHVRRYEPRLALDGGPDGLRAYRRLLADAPRWLRPGGVVLLEIGALQGAAVAELARQAWPEATATVHRDLAGLDRIVAVQT